MNEFHDLTGTTICGLTALEYLGNQIYKCRCNTCGKEYTLTTSAFKGGIAKCRRCTDEAQKGPKADLTGMKIGSIKVNRYLEKSLWECECKCGRIIKVKTFNLTEAIKHNKNYMCKDCSYEAKHNETDMTGMKINSWKILKYKGEGFYECQCDCGAIHTILGKTIRNGTSKSCRKCGCKDMINTRLTRYGDIGTNLKVTRTDEQVHAVMNKDNLREFIEENFDYKPKAIELGRALGIGETMAIRKVHLFGLEDIVTINEGSVFENDIFRYLESICDCSIIRHDRKLLRGKELDIYIPDRKLAIEVNGVYWHSTIFKNKGYHQEKSIQCGKKGIQLIQIFEHEWVNPDMQKKIKQLLKNKLTQPERVLYARKCNIREIDNTVYTEFLNKYHLQNSANASIKIGCYSKDELVGVLGIGTPRFNDKYEYEVIRLSWKDDVAVVGGLQRLFKYFIRRYRPTSVITYSDLSKFVGTSYLKLGFKTITDKIFSEPNYIWVKASRENNANYETLSRYQTQKHKLIALGLGSEDETEDEIMERLGYLKIYDSGNIRLEWKSN
jgi:hypothetical protein